MGIHLFPAQGFISKASFQAAVPRGNQASQVVMQSHDFSNPDSEPSQWGKPQSARSTRMPLNTMSPGNCYISYTIPRYGVPCLQTPSKPILTPSKMELTRPCLYLLHLFCFFIRRLFPFSQRVSTLAAQWNDLESFKKYVCLV